MPTTIVATATIAKKWRNRSSLRRTMRRSIAPTATAPPRENVSQRTAQTRAQDLGVLVAYVEAAPGLEPVDLREAAVVVRVGAGQLLSAQMRGVVRPTPTDP